MKMRKSMKNEDELMYKAIRKGDVKAFERFYRKMIIVLLT